MSYHFYVIHIYFSEVNLNLTLNRAWNTHKCALKFFVYVSKLGRHVLQNIHMLWPNSFYVLLHLILN